MNNQQQPPQAIESEQALLSACLLGAADQAVNVLNASDFYRTAHQKIFSSIKTLYSSGSPVDIITIVDLMRQQKTLQDIGGAAYLFELTNSIPAAVSVPHTCQLIKEKSIKRALVARCNDLMQCAMDDQPLDDLLEKSKHVPITEITRSLDRQKIVDICNVYDAAGMLDCYKEYISTLKNNRFITSIAPIDRTIRGVAGGETLFVLARAGAYKTALLQNMLRNYVNNSAWGAVFFSLEMPVANVTERYLQMFELTGGKSIEKTWQERDAEQLESMQRRFVMDLKRFFVVPTKVSLRDIERYVQIIQDRKSVKIGVIGIDYMGLVDEPGREYEQISAIARGSKELAKYLNIPVVVLSQLNRQAESGEKEVTLSMGRGSGVIEEAADFILGLWKSENDLIAKILKNRKGPAGSMWQLELYQDCFLIGPNAQEYKRPENTCKDY
jgi:replicative DNA helicase